MRQPLAQAQKPNMPSNEDVSVYIADDEYPTLSTAEFVKEIEKATKYNPQDANELSLPAKIILVEIAILLLLMLLILVCWMRYKNYLQDLDMRQSIF